MLKQGNLRGERVQYPDGTEMCVWYPLSESEDAGMCFDFKDSDAQDMVVLVQRLIETEPTPYAPEPEVPEPTPSVFQRVVDKLRSGINWLGWKLIGV